MVVAEWTGEYPCLCSGEWRLTIGGVDWSNAIPADKRFSHMNTAGTYQEWWFDDDMCEQFGDYEDGLDFEEWIAENEWVMSLPAAPQDVFQAIQAQDFSPGECGGCI